MAGLHVGGKSALALHGVRHNLAGRDSIVLWGYGRATLPLSFTSRFPARYVSARLFDWPAGAGDTTTKGASVVAQLDAFTVGTPAGVTEGLHVAHVERATLELLHDVGTHEGLEEARNLFDGLRNVRIDIIGRLLSCCTSVKAVRLFLTWARETALVDVDDIIRQYRPRVGSDKRWMSRLPDGTLLTLKPHG